MFDFDFEFLNELVNNTHEERKVARYEKNGLFIDTCAVNDSSQPYETAVAHPNYNNDELIIVQRYDTKEQARKGHDKWVKKMTAKELPKAIKDVSTSDVVEFAHALGIDLNEIYPSA